MRQKIVHVNRSGGHVAIIVRSVDMAWWDPRTGPNSTKGAQLAMVGNSIESYISCP